MDDATINTTIAKRCGWKWNGHHWLSRNGKVVEAIAAAPHFTESLTWMSVAERTLRSPKRRAAYIDALHKAAGGGLWKFATAPARTRALAFLAATENRSVSND
jgi:hypothetical protein